MVEYLPNAIILLKIEPAFIFALVFGGLLGMLCVIGGGYALIEPFQYRIRKEATLIGVDTKIYKKRYEHYFVCEYEYDGRKMIGSSDESYTQKEVDKKYKHGKTITIWVNVKEPKKFRIKRFHGVIGGIIMILYGLLTLNTPIQVWQSLH